jgi:short subunit dehydrogenase-like uncharacterized protein
MPAPVPIIYGANGYTGGLIVEEAVRRGLRPVLAGRDAPAVRALAARHGLEAGVFTLDEARRGLEGAPLVLHCAGPFSATCAPMVEACLATGAHYVDITGEIDVFVWCHEQHGRRGPRQGRPRAPRRRAGDGAARLEDARVRARRARSAVTIPWGDVYTAHLSTGIPDVEVYMTASPRAIAGLRRLRLLGPLLRTAAVQRFLKSRVGRAAPGPDAARRAATGCHVWGEARDAAGRVVRLGLATPNGYDVTVSAALGIVQRLLGGAPPAGGYYTPSQLMGAEYALGLPGVRLIQ